jgi:hypothetical protein
MPNNPVFPNKEARWLAYQQIFEVHPVGKKVFLDLVERVFAQPDFTPSIALNHGLAVHYSTVAQCRRELEKQLIKPRPETQVEERDDVGGIDIDD